MIATKILPLVGACLFLAGCHGASLNMDKRLGGLQKSFNLLSALSIGEIGHSSNLFPSTSQALQIISPRALFSLQKTLVAIGAKETRRPTGALRTAGSFLPNLGRGYDATHPTATVWRVVAGEVVRGRSILAEGKYVLQLEIARPMARDPRRSSRSVTSLHKTLLPTPLSYLQAQFLSLPIW